MLTPQLHSWALLANDDVHGVYERAVSLQIEGIDVIGVRAWVGHGAGLLLTHKLWSPGDRI